MSPLVKIQPSTNKVIEVNVRPIGDIPKHDYKAKKMNKKIEEM